MGADSWVWTSEPPDRSRKHRADTLSEGAASAATSIGAVPRTRATRSRLPASLRGPFAADRRVRTGRSAAGGPRSGVGAAVPSAGGAGARSGRGGPSAIPARRCCGDRRRRPLPARRDHVRRAVGRRGDRRRRTVAHPVRDRHEQRRANGRRRRRPVALGIPVVRRGLRRRRPVRAPRLRRRASRRRPVRPGAAVRLGAPAPAAGGAGPHDPSFRGTPVEDAAAASGIPVAWHPGYELAPDRLPSLVSYRGPEAADAATRIAGGRPLTPASLGRARRAEGLDPQLVKRVWHLLAAHGRVR